MSLIWNRTHAWDDADWRSNAACRDTEPELFFPIGTTGMATDQIESAKRVCHNCDAQKACLEFALATNQESGVWVARPRTSAANCASSGWPRVVARPRSRDERSAGPLRARRSLRRRRSPHSHLNGAEQLRADDVAHDRESQALGHLEEKSSSSPRPLSRISATASPFF